MSISSRPTSVFLCITCPDPADLGHMSTIPVAGVVVIPTKTPGWLSGGEEASQHKVSIFSQDEEGKDAVKKDFCYNSKKQLLPLKMFK